jgi:hypothetical protein
MPKILGYKFLILLHEISEVGATQQYVLPDFRWEKKTLKGLSSEI